MEEGVASEMMKVLRIIGPYYPLLFGNERVIRVKCVYSGTDIARSGTGACSGTDPHIVEQTKGSGATCTIGNKHQIWGMRHLGGRLAERDHPRSRIANPGDGRNDGRRPPWGDARDRSLNSPWIRTGS
jgi:hypothetical protein